MVIHDWWFSMMSSVLSVLSESESEFESEELVVVTAIVVLSMVVMVVVRERSACETAAGLSSVLHVEVSRLRSLCDSVVG